MSDWSVNNRACTSVWIALRLLEQSKKTFDKSGNISMNKLLFWNAGASADLRRLQAKTLAKQMDNIFRNIDGAVFEDGVTVSAAVQEMVEVLIVSDKTLTDLADVCDTNYRFWGEVQ